MSNSANHNCANYNCTQLTVILSEAKDLAYGACHALNEKRDTTSHETFLAPLGMTSI